jgi:ribonucleoside-triphosphate reductase
LDINALENFKRNIQCVIDERCDDIDDVFSGAQKDGRGNICPVTVILPTLAMITKQKIEKKALKEGRKYTNEELFDEFMNLLEKKINEAKDTLLERFNHIASQSCDSAKFMYENGTMAGYHPEEGIISALKHGTLTLGQLGVAEALIIMFGYDQTNESGLEKATEIEKLYDRKCAEFKAQYSLNFANYYTPAENLCYTAMKNFKKRFKGFEQENVTYTIEPVMVENEEGRLVQAVDENGKPKFERTEKMFFTNSIHVPVWHDLDAFKKIDIESKLTKYGTGGCITYVELPAKCYHNIDAVEEVVDYAMEHDVPYFAINIPLNRCACCGEPIYDESKGCCPKCGCEKIIRLGRITGYLSTTVEHFNKGKQQEFGMRKKHFKN